MLSVHAEPVINDRLLSSKDVCQKLGGKSITHLWRLRKDPSYRHLGFPAPKLINNRPYWRESLIDSWIDSMPDGEAA